MKLLGTPPNQITEAEKMRRLQDICDRWMALHNAGPADQTAEAAIMYFQALCSLKEEEHQLDRDYPDEVPDGCDGRNL